MKALDCLLTRRSIRKYSDKPVTGEQIQTLLKYAMYAPSAVNTQPWQFVAINDKTIFKAIRAAHPYSQMLDQAAWAILVCGDETLEHAPGYLPMDCSAATQNLLLAAHAMGFGAVWMGIYPETGRIKALRDAVKLPETIQPMTLVAIGYPAEVKKKIPDRFKPERIHWNQYEQ